MSIVAGRRPTAADVGRAAGVSRATVGYVLNDVVTQTIPAVTRERVLEAAARLGYTPSAAARALRAGRSEVVLCLVPDWPIGSAFTAQMTALSGELESRGYTFLTHPYSAANRPLAEVLRAVTPAVVLTLAELSAADERVLDAARIRAVPFGVPDPGASSTAFLLGRAQAEHLLAGGRRSLAYAYPTDPRVGRAFADERVRGVAAAVDAVRGARLRVDPVPFDAVGFDRVVGEWTAAGVDGVCAYNDEFATGVLAAAAAAGLAVPGSLAVIGVDDDPSSALLRPALTTVIADPVTAAARLAAVLTGEDTLAHDGDVRVIVRASTVDEAQ